MPIFWALKKKKSHTDPQSSPKIYNRSICYVLGGTLERSVCCFLLTHVTMFRQWCNPLHSPPIRLCGWEFLLCKWMGRVASVFCKDTAGANSYCRLRPRPMASTFGVQTNAQTASVQSKLTFRPNAELISNTVVYF